MNTEGHLRFFEISSCGYYNFKRNDSKAYGGELKETFVSLQDWFSKREFKDTTPWSDLVRTTKPQCYCRDIYQDSETDDFIVVLWKADTSMTGSIYGVAENAKGGNGKTVEIGKKKAGEKMIWGMPCYYWVIPDKKIVVSIKFDNSLTDASLFQEYISSFMGIRIKNDKRKEVQETKDGYLRFVYIDAEDSPDCLLSYRFHMHQIQTKTSTLSHARIAQKTKRLIRRSTIKTVANNDKPWYTKVFSSEIVLKNDNQDQKVEVKMDVNLTSDDVKKLLEEASKSTNPQDDNIGFVDSKDGITWADKHLLKASLYMNKASQATHYNAATVYDAISKKRNGYIKLIEDYQKAILNEHAEIDTQKAS